MEHSFFEDILNVAQVNKIVDCMQKYVPRSKEIITEGEEGNRLYVLEYGKLEVSQV